MSAAPLLQAVLGFEARAELLRDLSACATVHAAQIDDGSGTRACRVDEVFAALEDGSARRALVRYEFDGKRWTDVLMPSPEGVRLTRMADDDAADDDATDNAAADDDASA
jgi:hypothetical protein